jgi:DNA invertase Pin-like site-specific DNA recombinase
MTVYGYARVSTDDQSLTSQDAELHAAGCAKVYAEKIAATDRSSPRCSSASTQGMC